MTDSSPRTDARTALRDQLAIEWSYANDYIIGQISPELAAWKPCHSSVTVHETPNGWTADWIDEDNDTVPAPPTICWLLWHIEWWWTNTLAQVNNEPMSDPADFLGSGSTRRIMELKAQWDDVLATRDLDEPIDWVMPTPQPLGRVAGWVNFELAKNLSEIGQLKMLHANC